MSEEDRELMHSVWLDEEYSSLLKEVIEESNNPEYMESVLFPILQNVWEKCIDRKLELIKEVI